VHEASPMKTSSPRESADRRAPLEYSSIIARLEKASRLEPIEALRENCAAERTVR
jgi:hypothetical protein